MNPDLAASPVVARRSPGPATGFAPRDEARIAPARLPRLLSVVVVAFAPYEARPLFGAVQLFRGIAIQLAYRWPTGRVLAGSCDRAVLLWSVPFQAGGRPVRREALGVLVATVLGVGIVIVGNALFLVPLGAALGIAGVSTNVLRDAGVSVVEASLLMTVWRACRAHRNESALARRLPSPFTTRWRIDYLAAVPVRRGYGGRLLEEFLRYADEHHAEVVLHCGSRNVAFYRQYGFRPVGAECPDGQSVMRRNPCSSRQSSCR